jgi:hypothetical protein
MENLIETIRIAVQSDATDDAKHQGAHACRTILIALEAKAGEPLVLPTQAPTDVSTIVQSDQTATPAAPPIGPQQVAAIVGALRGMPPEQLLDLAIARLRAALPSEATTPTIAPVRFQIIPIGQLAASVGVKGAS